MAPNRHSPGSRDHNEHLFTELLRRAGVRYNLAPEGHGLDIYVFTTGGIQCWEIKNPDVSPSDRRLTKREEDTKKECEALGIPYYVFEEPEEAAKVLNP